MTNTTSEATTPSIKARSAPRAFGLPVIGQLYRMALDPLEFLRDTANRHGDVVYLGRIHGRGHYLLSNPRDIQHVLSTNQSNFDRGDLADMLRPLVGNGLPTASGELWRRQRRLIMPAFQMNRLAPMAGALSEIVEDMFGAWDAAAAAGEAIDIAHEMTRLAGRMLARALFSHDIRRGKSDLGLAITTVFRHLYQREYALLRLPDWVPSKRVRQYREQLGWFHEEVRAIIDERRSQPRRGEDLLSILMEARDEQTGEAMSAQQLHDEVTTLLIGGYDTTSIVLAFGCMLLSQNPDALAKLRAEIDTVLSGRRPSGEDLDRLSYSRLVFLEAMRLYPPAWCNARVSLGDDVLGGYRIPANSTILFSPFTIHRLPAYWESPEQFAPERFTPERSEGRPRYAYLPFGGGKRICVGMPLAIMEAQIVFAMVMRRYDFSLVEGHPIELEPRITMWPKHGLRMRVNRRAEPDSE